jgi:hypothetical protein
VEILNFFPPPQSSVILARGCTGGLIFLPGDGVPPGAVAPDGDSVVVCSDAARAAPLQNMNAKNASTKNFVNRIDISPVFRQASPEKRTGRAAEALIFSLFTFDEEFMN